MDCNQEGKGEDEVIDSHVSQVNQSEFYCNENEKTIEEFKLRKGVQFIF